MIDPDTPLSDADDLDDGDTASDALADDDDAGTASDALADDDDAGTPDLVDTMTRMQTSGRIDTAAFLGERNDDDVAMLGEEGIEDGDIVDE